MRFSARIRLQLRAIDHGHVFRSTRPKNIVIQTFPLRQCSNLSLTQFQTENRCALFLELLTLLPQLRTENRCALFLELLTLLPQLPTENRCELFLELL